MGESAPTVVSVGFPAAIAGLYDYAIPVHLQGAIRQGMPVLVEVRKKPTWGVAVRLKHHSDHPTLKEVQEIREGELTDAYRSLIGLYEWIASYYQCEIGRVFKPLIKKGLLEVTPRAQVWYTVVADCGVKLTAAQHDAVRRLRDAGGEVAAGEPLERLGVSKGVAETLCRKKALNKSSRPVLRTPSEMASPVANATATLTGEQTAALEQISAGLQSPGKPFLLHGITGSGKTFVYIELARRALQMGKGVIILVPEISLTPQTVWRFRSGLGDDIAVFHSGMTEAERRDGLQDLVTGRKRLVVGARSAILVPIDNLGLIVVDEEHDASYKQAETDPRYHARDVAIVRGKLQGATVVLGSATPGVESYHNALTGKYELIRLDRRFGQAALPRVTVVDMNQEHHAGNWTPLSHQLHARISEALSTGRQCILLLNRRGFSVSLICKDCGHTYSCEHCSVKLTYHSSDATLKCHQCGFVLAAPDVCPACRGGQLKYKGLGIQKAETFLMEQFPGARIVRMDQDTTRGRGAHVSILEKFGRHEADILLGTQMVAKGLDFAGVSVVGVLHADMGLCIPDFRAGERTFQLLAQVAGRAGREDNMGEVVIQTYFPFEQAILSAQEHDYASFFAKEIEERKKMGYPPFRRLARIVVEGPKEAGVRARISAIAATVKESAGEQVACLGPSPAAFERIEDHFRHTMLLKAASSATLTACLSAVRRTFLKAPGSMRVIIDVDPINML